MCFLFYFYFMMKEPDKKTILSFPHSIDNAQKHKHIAFIQLFHPGYSLLHQFGILRGIVKKLLRSNFKIITDRKKVFQRGHGFPG